MRPIISHQTQGMSSAGAGRAIFLAVALLAALLPSGFAETVAKGYFEGSDLRPLFGADLGLVAREPAVVLVFSPSAENLDSVVGFDRWAASRPAGAPPALGLIVASGDESRPAIEEMLFQKSVKVPVYFTRTDFLSGKQVRLIVTSNGAARDIQGMDLPAADRAMAELRGSPPPPPTNPTTATVAAATVTTAAVDAAVTTTPVAPPKGVEYRNSRFRFVVYFPEGWDVEEASNRAGAKAESPEDGVTLDMRAYGTVNEGGEDAASRKTAEDYFNGFQKRMARRGCEDIKVTGRYEVTDGQYIGREYEYSFTQSGPGDFNTDESGRCKGRIQVFETGPAYKIVLVEGAAAEYDRNRALIDQFMESFHPY
jgi:hypothetical protein